MRNGIGPEGAAAIGEALKVNGSLTLLDVRNNYISTASIELLRDIVKDRSGFELKM